MTGAQFLDGIGELIDGVDDLDMWRRQAVLLPPGSPLRPTAVAEATRLENELGHG